MMHYLVAGHIQVENQLVSQKQNRSTHSSNVPLEIDYRHILWIQRAFTDKVDAFWE